VENSNTDMDDIDGGLKQNVSGEEGGPSSLVGEFTEEDFRAALEGEGLVLEEFEEDKFADAVDAMGTESAGKDGGGVQTVPEGASVYRLRLPYIAETLNGWILDRDCAGELARNQAVVVQSRYGRDLALVRGKIDGAKLQFTKAAKIERIVRRDEAGKLADNKVREKEAFDICKNRIIEHGLDMKLVSAHYLFDEPKIMFFFSADKRIDFRGLVKDLLSAFRSRIELRQIAPRDESRMSCGEGICGRCYCCSSIASHLKVVTIKMAKEQNLSLNNAKISGPCGRLLCCLGFEHNFYVNALKPFPPRGTRIRHDGMLWNVQEVNVIRGLVTMLGEEGRLLTLPKERFEKVRAAEGVAEGKNSQLWSITNADEA
jgi:cell fate regulator YaaT (PSP1 superfamily)